MMVSSANILTLPEGQHIDRSLMNSRKSSGPKTELWGTPHDADLVSTYFSLFEHIVYNHLDSFRDDSMRFLLYIVLKFS